jgi:Mg2+ and Co2+ transporter CorA
MTQNLPTIQTKREKQVHNIVRALKSLQGVISGLASASSFCAHADMMDVSMHLKKMAAMAADTQKHLRTIYKSGPVDYNSMRLYKNLEIVIGDIDESST